MSSNGTIKKTKAPKPEIPTLYQTIPKLSEKQLDDLFTHMWKFPKLFTDAIERIEECHFGDEDIRFTVLFKACRDLANDHNLTPGSKQFRRRLKNQIRQTVQQFSYFHGEYEADELESMTYKDGYVDTAFAVPLDELSEAHGRELLKRFLTERTAFRLLEKTLRYQPAGHLPKNLSVVLEEATKNLRAVENITTKTHKSLGEEWGEHQARLKPFRNRDMIGLRTGQSELDRRTLGLRGLNIFGAKPGAGKTAYSIELALGICQHHAENDAVVVILCLDMDRFDLYRRIQCNLCQLGWKVLMFGSPNETRLPGSDFSQVHADRLAEGKKKLEKNEVGKRVMILDHSLIGEHLTAQRIAAIVQEHKAKAGAKRALLMVDYLQLLPVPDEVTAAGDVTADKHRIRMVQEALEASRTAENPLGDTALVISEARKPPNAKIGWGDSMSDVMGSARISYAADAVLLYREMSNNEIGAYYGKSDATASQHHRQQLLKQGIVPIMLILEKGRDGMTRGHWGAEFHFQESRFVELPPTGKTNPAEATIPQHEDEDDPPYEDDEVEDDEPEDHGDDEGDTSEDNTGTIPLPKHFGNGKSKTASKAKKVTVTLTGSTHAAKTVNYTITSKPTKKSKQEK